MTFDLTANTDHEVKHIFDVSTVRKSNHRGELVHFLLKWIQHNPPYSQFIHLPRWPKMVLQQQCVASKIKSLFPVAHHYETDLYKSVNRVFQVANVINMWWVFNSWCWQNVPVPTKAILGGWHASREKKKVNREEGLTDFQILDKGNMMSDAAEVIWYSFFF